jgi:hypothetical protein
MSFSIFKYLNKGTFYHSNIYPRIGDDDYKFFCSSFLSQYDCLENSTLHEVSTSIYYVLQFCSIRCSHRDAIFFLFVRKLGIYSFQFFP